VLAQVPLETEPVVAVTATEPEEAVATVIEIAPVAQEAAQKIVGAAAEETTLAVEPATTQAPTEAAEEFDDNFIKEKVAAAKAAKKKATPRTRKPSKREREKLPDLGDGSGYEPPEAAASASSSEGAATADEGEEAFWYAVHCYSGYENKVKHSLEQRIETMGMAGRILEIVVPTEEEIEVRDGKRKTVERRVFPGYVLVRMKMSEESWFVVRNTPGVTRFIGMGNRPQPLSQQEVNQVLRRMEAEAPKIRVSFKTGQRVRITDGPFADFPGLVDKIDTERAKVTVLVSFFGRETPVELDFLQVEKT
jgi:transcriptional antiterminator NusG